VLPHSACFAACFEREESFRQDKKDFLIRGLLDRKQELAPTAGSVSGDVGYF